LNEAHAECSRALGFLRDLDAPILRYQGHFLSGQVEHTRGNLGAAYDAYQAARTELESLRSSLRRDELKDELKISFMKKKTELYERLVDLCISGEPGALSAEEAFRYVELAKSRSLTELLFHRSHTLPEGQTGQSELVQKIRELREELNWYQHRIEQEQLRPEQNAGARIEQLRLEAQEREKSLLEVLADLPQNEGDSAAPGQGVVALEVIRSYLGSSSSILEYFFVGDRIVAAVVTKDTIEVLPITTSARVLEAMRMLRFQLGRCQFAHSGGTPMRGAMDRATAAHLKELWDELIAPVRPLLTTQHLIIVPHGQLHYLPFHALLNGEEFLLDSFTISYAPSASVFALCHAAASGNGMDSLVLGVPDEQAPMIRQEVESVHRALAGSELFLGEAASHDALASKAKSARVVHIATHGSFRPDNPMFSGIRLGDGYLHLYELYQMQLPVELLALSGCATGLNVVAAGDELLGLIRGALFAGAKSLLLTLWDVNDSSTTQFMESFYRRWQGPVTKAEALAGAAREVRGMHPHPYYWAPFVLVGKGLSS
jgi:CHAT domain-containing protein